MAKHRGLTLQKFLDAVGEELLRSYFRKRNVSVPTGFLLDFEGVRKLLGELPNEDLKSEIYEAFHCINDVAEKGQDYLEIAKDDFGIETPEDEPREKTAMRLFLNENPDVFQTAYDYYLYRTISADLSHHQFKEGKANFSNKSLGQFKDRMIEYHRDQARGRDCRVRQYRDGDKRFILVARGDFVKTQPVWEKGKLRNRYFRPAKEDILIFNTKNSVLSVKIASRKKKDKIESIKAFGNHILGLAKIENEVLEGGLVSLVPIQNGTFNYVGNEYIKSIKLVEVQVRIQEIASIRFKITSKDLVGPLKRILNFSIEDGELISAKLSFTIERDGKRQRPLTVELRPPEHTNLNKKRDIEVIEDYLRKNDVLLV